MKYYLLTIVYQIFATREKRSLVSHGTQKYVSSLLTLRNIDEQLAGCNAPFAGAAQCFTSQPQASVARPPHNPVPNSAPPRPPVTPQQPQYQAQRHPSPHHQPTPQGTHLTPSLATQSNAGNVILVLVNISSPLFDICILGVIPAYHPLCHLHLPPLQLIEHGSHHLTIHPDLQHISHPRAEWLLSSIAVHYSH